MSIDSWPAASPPCVRREDIQPVADSGSEYDSDWSLAFVCWLLLHWLTLSAGRRAKVPMRTRLDWTGLEINNVRLMNQCHSMTGGLSHGDKDGASYAFFFLLHFSLSDADSPLPDDAW